MDDTLVPSLFELAVFKLLKDVGVDKYADTLNAVMPYFQSKMHECAKKYYSAAEKTRQINQNIQKIFKNNDILEQIFDWYYCYHRFEISSKCAMFVAAFIDRNYVFIVTELDLPDEDETVFDFSTVEEYEINENTSSLFLVAYNPASMNIKFSAEIIRTISVVTLLHYRQYKQCLLLLKYGSNSYWLGIIFSVIRRLNNSEFGICVWNVYREKIFEEFKTSPKDNWICRYLIPYITELRIKNAIENESWSELYEFVNSLPQEIYLSSLFYFENNIKYILSDVRDRQKSETTAETLEKMRQHALKLTEPGEIFFTEN